MDSVASIGLMLGAAHLSKDALADAVKRLIGPSADSAGHAFEQFLFHRTKRATAVLEDGVRMLDDAGVQPQQVAPRILIPILQDGSLEEDPDLQTRWAALLANAASPALGTKMMPAFAEILRQLTPVQAHLVQWMYDQQEHGDGYTNWPALYRADLEEKFQLSPDDFALLVTDLERLRVIEDQSANTRALNASPPIDQRELNRVLRKLTEPGDYDPIALTTLGVRFIEACTPPRNESQTPRSQRFDD